jgi:hypothetical protein
LSSSLQSLQTASAKVEFLDSVTEFFPASLEETFEAVWLRSNANTMSNSEPDQKVTLALGWI